jgi:hypothetical protein
MPPVSIARIPFILDGFLSRAFPGSVIAFPGEVFDPGKQSGIWLRPTFKPAGAMQDYELGQNGYSRRDGLYLVDIFAPEKLGKSRADALNLAALIEAAFRRKCAECVNFGDPYTDDKGVDSYNNYFVRVTVPWWCWAQ